MSPPAHDPVPTGLNLDSRQRAMLAEMKIPVWWPQTLAHPELEPDPELQPDPEPAAGHAAPVKAMAIPLSAAPHEAPPGNARQAAGPVAPQGVSFPAKPPLDAEVDGSIGQMDWVRLRDAVQGCSACALCEGRKAPVFVANPVQADWLIVGEPPDEHEERAGEPMVGPAGQLLDNMLRAVQLTRHGRGNAGARLTPVVKCRPQAPRNPTVEELARCAVYLRREIALAQPRVIVAMGRFAALSLLGCDYPELLQLPFGQMRGTVYRCAGIPVVVTYHPSKLLRAPLQKAHVWADLCLARAQTTTPPAPTPT